ncbi:MAG: OmpA family protein, partial [Bacteroidales bacterium]|nr:OmpA family protein [Bacteroidales bacterium]
MKRNVFLLLVMAFIANVALAQEPDTVGQNAASQDDTVIFPRNLVGIRGGVNFADMAYSYDPINKYYDHFLQPQGMVGLFGHFQLGKSNFAIRPEVAFVGRADSLEWLDVRYRLKAHYLDLRLPITYNIRLAGRQFSPYLMVAPQLNLAYGGRVSYHADDYPQGVFTDITKADINGMDASVLMGAGVDFLIPTKSIPVMLSLEAGYNLGLCNTFSKLEVLDNPSVAAADRSVIINPFFGAELYQETRKNRGIEVALRIALPIDDSWKNPAKKPVKPIVTTITDTVYVPDTVYVVHYDTTIHNQTDTVYILQPQTECNDSLEYVRKDCYSFGEMYAFIKLGVDISDKRICLFNINFDFDSYRLRKESYPHLDEVAMMMNAFPEMRIKIIGHTDSLGSDKYNQTLSYNRAKSVIRYLQSKGIDKDRMVPEGFGEKYPIDTNSTPEGRFHNRRVEIEVLNVGIRNTDTNYKEK